MKFICDVHIYDQINTVETTQLSVPVTPNQIISLARQLSQEDKKKLFDVLSEEVETEKVHTHWASEQVLGKEWLNETEEQAWQHL